MDVEVVLDQIGSLVDEIVKPGTDRIADAVEIDIGIDRVVLYKTGPGSNPVYCGLYCATKIGLCVMANPPRNAVL